MDKEAGENWQETVNENESQKCRPLGLVNKAQVSSKEGVIEDGSGTTKKRPKTKKWKHLARDIGSTDENQMSQLVKKRSMGEVEK